MENMINKDDLIGITDILDSLQVLCGDIMQDYFDKYNPAEDDDQLSIIYSFERMRAYSNIVFNIICQVNQELCNDLHILTKSY